MRLENVTPEEFAKKFLPVCGACGKRKTVCLDACFLGQKGKKSTQFKDQKGFAFMADQTKVDSIVVNAPVEDDKDFVKVRILFENWLLRDICRHIFYLAVRKSACW